MNKPDTAVINQHLIDPEICIRCDTCESICPIDAITHDDTNYVVKADICNSCMDCISPCPTGAIDNWRTVLRANAYSIESQLEWEDLPDEVAIDPSLVEASSANETATDAAPIAPAVMNNEVPKFDAGGCGSSLPPWSAAHAYTNLYGPSKTATATVVGNVRVTAADRDSDTHHVVLDFGDMPFPVLEGQSIGIIAPGLDARGKPHHARQYSIASPRNGERPGYNNVSLTVKRVLVDYDGKPVTGVCSNYVCDLNVGDEVQIIGPFGSSFLMPNHPKSNIIMICTGTGSAPMRAMTEWRRRLRQSGKFESGKLMLFFGARTSEELPYFGPLLKLPKDFIDISMAFSRTPDQPKTYVQDLIRKRAADIAPLLSDTNTFIFVCGLKAMEEGVVLALKEVAQDANLNWDDLVSGFKQNGRLHLETY